jgi:hypothetical protein
VIEKFECREHGIALLVAEDEGEPPLLDDRFGGEIWTMTVDGPCREDERVGCVGGEGLDGAEGFRGGGFLKDGAFEFGEME